MVIFRENTEDIYAGIEFTEGTAEASQFSSLLKTIAITKVRFRPFRIGIKPVSK